MEEQVTNNDLVLMKWVVRRTPQPVKIDGTNRTYIFSYNQGLCASWVNKEDVNKLLATRVKSCNCGEGGTWVNGFALCSRVDANLFLYNSRDKLGDI